ncbi:MAG: UvrD-helicase domain-containing protein [Patescibacteria group bacterium]
MSSTITNLNEEQIKAVQQTEGPVLVLAGAGSGKTKALTSRIVYLHTEIGIPLDNILAITFTNKAALEMKERVLQSLPVTNTRNLHISTFHSLCAQILRREGGKIGLANNFSILDAQDSLSAIKKTMERMMIDTKKTYPEAVRNSISSAKNELVDAGEYEKLANGSFQETVARIYPEYQKLLQDNQAVDFDDLIFLVTKMFKEQPDVLERYQNKFKYILIDEYQDTNTAQYTLANLLASQHRNLFVVGDDWQSIYSWRGANFENILNFSRDYPDAVVIKLEQNYRSTQTILDAAHALIEQNSRRSDKKLWTEQELGEPIVVYSALNGKDEADFIIKTAQELQAHTGASLNEMVVLYRTNAQSRSVEEAMLRAGVSYRVIGGVKFYDRKEIKDALAYLTLLNNPENEIALGRVINVPARGIGAKGWEKIQQSAYALGTSSLNYLLSSESLSGGQATFAKLIVEMQKSAKSLSLSKLLDHWLIASGYKEMLKSEGLEGETRLENIYELKSVMEKYDHLNPEEALTAFLEEVSLISDADNQQAGDEAITMMTIHTAKGLEFDYVFVVGLEENLFPHSRSLYDQAELEEERRLAYVAITRARKQVYLLHAQERLIYGNIQNNPPSRFIADLPEELVENVERHERHSGYVMSSGGGATVDKSVFKPGVKVRHQQFGDGTVIAKSGDVITVAFNSVGVKNLIPELAKLEVRK